MTLTFAALHINTNLYLCEFADAPTRGRELVFINGTNALVCLKATSRAWMAPICKYVRWASSQTHKSKTLPAERPGEFLQLRILPALTNDTGSETITGILSKPIQQLGGTLGEAVCFDGIQLGESYDPELSVRVEGRVTDEDPLRRELYEELKPFFQAGITKRVANLLEALRLEACAPDLPIKRDRICTGGENLFRGRRSV